MFFFIKRVLHFKAVEIYLNKIPKRRGPVCLIAKMSGYPKI